MEELAGWIAPAATMIAAMMTAANLGTRFTGWGFVVFTVGSIGWSIVAVTTDQQNLLLTNGFLTLVNVVGIWRWLGRQARYDDGGKAAERRSAASRVPTLFSASGMIGASVTGRGGATIATIVDAMLRCDSKSLAYVVVTAGGVAGVGETLHALAPDRLSFGPEGISADLAPGDLERLPPLDPDRWPAAV